MRLSLWQQFSSNHSASFTLVGTFETAEQAAKAADTARDMITRIVNYWNRLDEDRREEMYELVVEAGDLSPTEKRLRKQHGLENWDTGIDWIAHDPDAALDAVTLFERTVFIENTEDTWSGGIPFDALLEKLGGTIVRRVESDSTEIPVVITCSAPDEATAQRLIEETGYDANRPGLEIRIANQFAAARKVERDGLNMRYELSAVTDLPQALPAIVNYLRQQGCEDVAYRFEAGEG